MQVDVSFPCFAYFQKDIYYPPSLVKTAHPNDLQKKKKKIEKKGKWIKKLPTYGLPYRWHFSGLSKSGKPFRVSLHNLDFGANFYHIEVADEISHPILF